MPRRAPAPAGPGRRWVAAAGIVLLAVVVIALCVIALSRTRAAEPAGTARPVPTFSVASSPTPTPTAVSTAPGAAERFLAAGGGVLWRATAGTCGGTAPTLERSTDAGATWSDVTPGYLGVGQILALEPFAGDQAQIVALVGSACQAQALRTFTAGQFWASYPDALAASTYVDPVDSTRVVTPSGTIAGPCPAPWGVRADSGATALVCDGAAYQLTASRTWTQVATDAAALTVASGAVTVATSAQVASPAAVAFDGNDLLAWSGATVAPLP